MSDGSGSFSVNDFYDCGFTWCRSRLKKYVKDHPNTVIEGTGLISRITLVSLQKTKLLVIKIIS